MIWIIAGLLALGVLLYIARPLYSVKPQDQNTSLELEEYSKKIRELDAEIERDSDNKPELLREKTGLQRQLIGIQAESNNDNHGASAVFLSSLFVIFSFATIGLYSVLGEPDKATLKTEQKSQMNVSRAISQSEKPQHDNDMSLEQLVLRLEEKLERDKSNPEGWMLYARSLMTLKRFDEAQNAYENVLILTENNPNVASELAEARAYIASLQGPPMAGQNKRVAVPGPSREDMEAAAAMSDQDRQAMIQNMVDGLSAKLVENPRNVDGWIRLLKARKVLNQKDEAKAEIDRMTLAFEESPETVQTILTESGWTNMR